MSTKKPKSSTDDAITARHNVAALNRLEAYRTTYLNSIPHENFDRAIWEAVEIESTSVNPNRMNGKAEFSLIVPDGYRNYTGNLHGGAVATILDGLTNCTIAIIATRGFWDHSGVSRNLHVTYLRPVERGQKVFVECTILRASSRLVTIQGTMHRASDGAMLAIAMQEMVAISSPKL